MSQSLSQILLHITFSTKNRENLIRADIRNELCAYMAKICNDLGCFAHKINCVANHVHIACNLSRTITIAKLLEEIKKNSSKWLKTKGNYYQNFAWQGGYGAFSLGMSQLPTIIQYIEDQEEHHRSKTFKEEYLELLKRYHVEYDKRYIWD